MAPLELVEIARRTGQVFGGKPGSKRIYNQDKSAWIDVLASVDRPVKGLTSWGTVGLCQVPVAKLPGGQMLGIELVAVVKSEVWSM